MTKKIFRSVLLSTVLILIAAVALIIVSLNSYIVSNEKTILASQADLAASGVETSGKEYLENLRSDQYRLTWVDSDGTVLFDNEEDPASMSNHANREEIIEAFQNGTGECERYSSTLAQTTMYYAKKLSDNTVIRVAITRNSIWLTLLRMMSSFLWILIGAIAVSVFIARHISKSIVEPINHLNLEEPLSNQGYEEIQPLLRKLDSQNRTISIQMDELNQRKKEFNTVTDAISEGLILLDQNEQILFDNPAADDLFDLDETRELPSSLRDLIHQAKKGEPVYGVIAWKGRNIQIDASPAESNGVMTGISVMAADITETYKEEQVRREFTANVSHELKTPLQSIMGSSELLENNLVKEEDKPSFYEKIHHESARLLSLIDDIIRLSRLDEGEKVEESDLNLSDTVKEAEEALKDSAVKHDVTIIENLNDAPVHANMRLIYEIVYNLMDNAIRYNRPEGTVTVSTYTDKGHSVLKVSDTGIGIPKESLSRIFERFYRVDKSHSRATGGTGLGLSIVKHAVQISHGSIHVESEEGKGSTFIVRF